MDTSRTLRLLVASAAVFALAILATSPAQAYWANEGGGGPVVGTTVGNPGDGASIVQTAPQTVGNPGDGAQVSSQGGEGIVLSSSSDGFETGTFFAIAGGVVLALMLGLAALFLTARHRRVALP